MVPSTLRVRHLEASTILEADRRILHKLEPLSRSLLSRAEEGYEDVIILRGKLQVVNSRGYRLAPYEWVSGLPYLRGKGRWPPWSGQRADRATEARSKAKNPSEPTNRPPAGPRSREYFSSRGRTMGRPQMSRSRASGERGTLPLRRLRRAPRDPDRRNSRRRSGRRAR
jgi:hypothetical protein